MNAGVASRRAVLAGASALIAARGAQAQARPSVMVYAAASLQDALKDIAPLYTARTGSRVTFSFAGSSLLARQIEQGARADVFVSADLDWMDYLAQRRLVRPETRRNLVSARLALIAPRDSRIQLAIRRGFPLVQALGGGRLALADPDSVPAGRYARAALTSLGVWPAAAPRVARADNVRAALAFVARGEAPLGVVYDTDARAEPGVRVVGLFPPGSHPPIVYPAAATARSRAPAAAADFVRFLSRPQADEVFRRYGFTVVD